MRVAVVDSRQRPQIVSIRTLPSTRSIGTGQSLQAGGPYLTLRKETFTISSLGNCGSGEGVEGPLPHRTLVMDTESRGNALSSLASLKRGGRPCTR
jgi:hypothetical protein